MREIEANEDAQPTSAVLDLTDVTKVEVGDHEGALQDLTEFAVVVEYDQTTDEIVDACSVTFRRLEGVNSLAPLMTVNPPVKTGRTIVISIDPGASTYKEVFRGKIDTVDWPERFGDVVVQARDQAGVIADTWIETPQTYGSTAGVALETVMQSIATDNLASAPTLYVPSATSAVVTPAYEQQGESVLQAVRTLSEAIGWTIRWRYITSLSAWRWTLYEPARDKTEADHTFGASDYWDVTLIQQDIADVRNVVEVEYTDADGDRVSVTVSDSASIAKYGRRYMKISEETGSPINNATLATALANAALSDLKEPDAILEITGRYFWPGEVGVDLYDFTANDIHFSATQQLAPVAFRHRIAVGERSTTKIMCRGNPSGGLLSWIRRQERGTGTTCQPPTDLVLANNTGTKSFGDADMIIPRIRVTWTAADEPFIERYLLRWRAISKPVPGTQDRVDIADPEWVQEADPGKDDTQAYIVGVEQDIEYEVELRTVNNAGVRSAIVSDTIIVNWLMKSEHLALVGFRERKDLRTDTTATWSWQRGSLVHTLVIFDVLRERGGATEWPSVANGDPYTIRGPLADYDVEETLTVDLPGPNYDRLIQIEPWSEGLETNGATERALIEGAPPAIPYIDRLFTVPATYPRANVSGRVVDPDADPLVPMGGTLYVWTSPNVVASPDPDGAADAEIAFASAPFIFDSTDDAVLGSILYRPGQTKIVVFEAVMEDGRTTGQVSYPLEQFIAIIDPTGELTNGAINNTAQVEDGVITAPKLVIERHSVTGTVTGLGTATVSWSGLTVYYNGTAHSITNSSAASTSLNVVWFDRSAATLNTAADIDAAITAGFNDNDGDALIFITDVVGGVWVRAWNQTLITGTGIRTDSIVTRNIAASAITADEIAAGAVVASKVSVSTLSELTDNAGIIVSGKLTGGGATLDLGATGTQVLLEAGGLEILADGTTTLAGGLAGATGYFEDAFGIRSSADVVLASFSATRDLIGGESTLDVFADFINLNAEVTVIGDLRLDSDLILGSDLHFDTIGTVTFGANDSGGSGFRRMLVPNA